MHDYTGTATYPSSISLVDDSDPPNASNFNTAHEGNRNAIVFLRTNVGYRGKYRLVDTLDATFSLGTVSYTSTTYSTATVTEICSISSGLLNGDDFFDATIVFAAGVTANANSGAAHAVAGHFIAATKSGGSDWVWDAGSETYSEYFTWVNNIIVNYTPTTIRIRVAPGNTIAACKFGLAARVNTVFAANTASADIVASGKIFINWYRSN